MGEVRIHPLRDPETKAYSAAFFAEAFERELAKAARFRRPLSLVFLSVDHYGSAAEKTPAGQGAGTLAYLVEEIRKSLRDSDFIVRFAHDRFCVVLPETDRFGSVLAIRRLRKAVREMEIFRYPGRKLDLNPLFVSSTYPGDGKSFAELYRVSEEKLRRQRESPLHRLNLVETPFWEAFEILASGPERRDPPENGEAPIGSPIAKDLGRNGHFSLSRETYRCIVEAVAQDACSTGGSRGIVMAAGTRPEILKRIFLSLHPGGQGPGRLFVMDEALTEKEVLLYAKECVAYGIFALERPDEMRGFHTADEWLVEAMMEKLQEIQPSQENH